MSADLSKQLKSMRSSLSMRMRKQWDRDLPLEELVTDRWERAQQLGFGEGTSIHASSYVYGRPNIGRDVWIGPFTLLDATGGLSIGDGSTISAGVHIYSHDTVLRTLSGGQSPILRSPVVLGTQVYVGPQSVITSGVTVGDLCVIGAQSFVNRDLPRNTIAVGTPARRIGAVVVHDGEVELRLDEPGSV